MKRNHYIAALLLPALLMAGTVNADSNVINGVFTVGDGVTVQFAKGNLQNVCGSSTYTFASSQTTVIGAGNTMAGGSTRDLFSWNELNNDHSFVFTIGGETWSVLSSEEWSYLLADGRTNAAYLNSLGKVNGVNGLIILCDNFILPDGLTFTGNNNHYDLAANTYTSEEWAQMEEAGAVFLPCGGYGCYNSSHQFEYENTLYELGTYWSSTNDNNNTTKAYRIQFYNGTIHDCSSSDKTNYDNVRLVRVLTALDENDESTTFSAKMENLRVKSSVQIFRTLYKDGSFNTLCLPFNVPSISSSPLNGAEVYTFESGEVVNNVLQLDITQVTSNQLTKGVPYLIRWANDGTILGNMEFTGLIASDWDDNCSADGDAGSTSVKYHGFYYKTHLSDATDGAGNHYNLFLGADDELYWPTDGGVESAKMKGFRAHFYIVTGGEPTGSQSAAPWRGMPAMLRIVSRDNTVTGTEQVELQQAVEKAIRDGRIVLIIDGETYNMGGQRL